MRKMEDKMAALTAKFEERLKDIKKEHQRQISELRNENAALREDGKKLREKLNEIESRLQSQATSHSSQNGMIEKLNLGILTNQLC